MAACPDCLFDLVLDDQDHSTDWLRRGDVRAAVSAFGGSVQGCDMRPLGSLRYIATASPDFMQRWFSEGVTPETLARAPAMTFNAKDGLQNRWISQVFGVDLSPPTHFLGSSQAFLDGAMAGLGWGLNPLALARDALENGRLVEMVPDTPVDTPLYWHWSRSVGAAMAPVTRSVCEEARRVLLPVSMPPEPPLA